jgi:hypothetical protein
MNTKQIIRTAQLALAGLAALTLNSHAEARNHPNIIVVSPADLPELAREPGQAILLHPTGDGRTLLYIEQDHGARLAIFDVTDPAKIKQKPAVRLDAGGSFDFVSAVGDDAELVRFRKGQRGALLNLHKADVPRLDTIPGLDVHGPTERLGDDGFIVANRPNDLNYEVVATAPNPLQTQPVADVKQVRQQITNHETGTTFLLTAEGLYIIRRPAVEEENDIHQWQLSHPG